MVYKKYIKKNGKLVGPYYYESYRDGDKIKSRYLGRELPEGHLELKSAGENKTVALRQKLLIFSFALIMLFFLGGYLTSLGLTGHVVLDVSEQYGFNESLRGNVGLVIEENDQLLNSLDVELILSREGNVVVQTSRTLEEFLGTQASYEEISSVTEICTPVVEQICSNVTETREECSRSLMESICTNVTETNEVCNDAEPSCEQVTEIREVCTNNTIGQNCVNETITGSYYTTPGTYSVPIESLISYQFVESGSYKLIFSIPDLNLSVSDIFEVSLLGNGTSASNSTNVSSNLTKGVMDKFLMSAGNSINFTYPTPDNGTITNNNTIQVNISFVENSLREFRFNWNATNYTMYNDSLVLMMNFENYSVLGENSTRVADVSRYTNNGTVLGNTFWNATAGRYGGAYQFDGVDDNIYLGNNTFDFLYAGGNGKVTMMAWFKFTSLSGYYTKIIDLEGEYVVDRTSGNKIELFFTGTSSSAIESSTSVAADRWYHVAAVYNGTHQNLYINGILENQSAVALDNIVSYNDANRIGARFDLQALTGTFFNGTIDEVRILNRSLSAAEIKQMYYSNLQKYDVGAWNFYTNETGLTTRNYTYFGATIDTSGVGNKTETRTAGYNGSIGFTQSNYTFNVSRAQNVVRIPISNSYERLFNVSVNVTSITPAIDTVQFIGAGTFDTPAIIYSGETINLMLGAYFGNSSILNYTANISLYNSSSMTELSRTQVFLNLPNVDRYSFNSSSNSLSFSISNVNDVAAICSDSRKNFVITNNGSEPISDLSANVTGNLEIYMYPNLNYYKLNPGDNVTVNVRVVANETTATNTGTINISSAIGLSKTISVSYTTPGTTWGVSTGTSGTRLFSAHSDSFICVNHKSYSVKLDFPAAVAQNPILSSSYVGTFQKVCSSLQPHDTYFYLNGNQFLSILRTNYLDDYPGVPLGTVTSSVNPSYVKQNNTLLVTSENYQSGGHFCANTYNTLNVVVNLSDTNNTRYSTSYCDLCNQTESMESNFTDGTDNDCDGAIDCADTDSCGAAVCAGRNALICPTLETGTLCNDGVDNDLNGLTDCEQVQTCCGIGVCASAPGCRSVTGSFVDSCRNLSAAGMYYLQGDVHSNGTCFRITASGVQLRKGASTIYYGESGSGYGVEIANGASDVVVRDMIIIKNGSVGQNNVGIYVSNYSSQNIYLVNNTIRPNGTGYDDGIRAKTGDRRYVLNNTIILTSSGTSASTRGVYFEQSTAEDYRSNVTNTFIEGNNITTGLGRYGDGINLNVYGGFSNLSISQNTIHLYGDYSNGIAPCSTSCTLYEFVNITNNKILAFEHDDYGIVTKEQLAGIERNILVSNNNISVYGASSYGIDSPLSNAIFSFNNITSYSGAGIYIAHYISTPEKVPNNVSVFNNTVSSQGYGIYDAGTNSTIYNNLVNNSASGIWSWQDVSPISRDTGFVINNTITNISGTGVYLGPYKKAYKNYITSSTTSNYIISAGNYANVSDNNITANGGALSCGVGCNIDRNYITNSSINTGTSYNDDYSNITNNILLTSSPYGGGIYSAGNNATIFNNFINISYISTYGIYCGSSCNISYNNASINGSLGYGISAASRNLVSGNNILLERGYRGLEITGEKNIVKNNNVTILGGDSEGIIFLGANNITNNFIYMNCSGSSIGIADSYGFGGSPENSTISSNTIIINQQQASNTEEYAAISLGTSWNAYGNDNVTVYNNTIILNNSISGWAKGIFMGGLRSANISNNRINIYSNGTAYGIWENTVNNSDFIGNNITVNGSSTTSWGSCILVYGIYQYTSCGDNRHQFNNINAHSFGTGSCANNSYGIQTIGSNSFIKDNIDSSGYEIVNTLTSGDCINLTNVFLAGETNMSSPCIRMNAATSYIGVNSTPPSVPSWTRSTYDFMNFEAQWPYPPTNTSFNFSYKQSEANFFEDTLRIYRYNYTTLEWDVLPKSTVDITNNNVYSGNISEFSLFGALGDVIKLENLQCNVSGAGFANCSTSYYSDNITSVRANCTAYNMSVINVTLNLTNIYDGQNFFVGVTIDNATGWFVYNNADVEILDSGNWTLSATCYASNGTDDFHRHASDGFEIPFGNLTSATIVRPSGNANVTKNEAFYVNTSISCVGGECINVSVTLDPEKQTSALPSCSGYTVVNCASAHENCYWFWIDMDMGLGMCSSSEFLCGDSADNDGDVSIDCVDTDCAEASNCVIPDADGDGVPDATDTMTGNASNVTSSGISNLSITFNGVQNNNPAGVQIVAFYNGSTKLFEFVYDFSGAALDLTAVNVTKRRDEIYAQGLSGISKTFYIPVGSGKGVCVRNNAGLISSLYSCSGTNEYLITNASCNGTLVTINGDSVNCSVQGGVYNISGMTNSGGGPYSKGTMPMNAGTPFYTTNQNPRNWTTDSCLSLIRPGQICNSSWRVIPTGTAGDAWEFFAVYSKEGSSLDTNKINITINLTSLQVTIPSPSATTYSSADIKINISLDEVGYCEYTLDDGLTNYTMSANTSNTGFNGTKTLSNGAYTLRAYCNASFGVINRTETVSFNVNVQGGGGGGGGDGGSCTPAYSYSDWGSCVNGVQNRTKTDTLCHTADSIEYGDCETPLCVPDWSCSEWGACEGGERYRTCTDLNNCEYYAEKPAESMDCGCQSNYICNNWGACSYEERLSDLFEGTLNLFGRQARNCVDINHCSSNYTIMDNCTMGFNITISRESLCGDDSLVVSNALNEKPVSIISLDTLKNDKLDISFVQSKARFCSTCYNGVRDGDELGADCGGSCIPCMREAFSWLWLIILILIVIECLITRYFYKNRDYVQLDYYMLKDDFRAYRELKRRDFREWYRNSKFTRIFGRSVT